MDGAIAEARPASVVFLPVLFEKQVKAVISLSSFAPFSDVHQTFFDQLTELFGIVLNTIAATMRTEDLLKRSQALANELQQHGFGSTELARHADQRNPHQASGLRAQSTTLSDSSLGRRRESARG